MGNINEKHKKLLDNWIRVIRESICIQSIELKFIPKSRKDAEAMLYGIFITQRDFFLGNLCFEKHTYNGKMFK
jgi:hypothetical protein